MKNPSIFFAVLIILALIIQAFYAMMEMACVSFNKVRLQYFMMKKKRRALWLSALIKHPARLFGTTLIGVNAAMQFGSEAARRFYTSLGINPDFAPLTQVILVLIFAELAPLFAARRYAEHVAWLGIPLLYISSKILAPIIWVLDLLCRGINRIFGISHLKTAIPLSREELQKAIEEPLREEEIDTILSKIFSLKDKTAKDLMEPVTKSMVVSSDESIGKIREQLAVHFSPYLLIYQNSMETITGVIYPRDLIRLVDSTFAKDASRPPWFITEKNSIFQILKQFHWNNQHLALVLNERGMTTGVLTLDGIIDEIFGEDIKSLGEFLPQKHQIFVERSFPGDASIESINRKYHIYIKSDGEETLESLMKARLGHLPTEGETIYIDGFELTAEETTLLEITKVRVRSVIE